MATKPLTTEAIALTEKKMGMTLDDIIKMSKTVPSKGKTQRVSNKSQKFSNGINRQKSFKVQRFMESRSSLRQGALTQRRSSFQGNQFPLATEVARKAAVAPISYRASNNRNQARGWNKSRVGVPALRKPVNRGFAVKQQQQQLQRQGNATVPKQRPQTLDSLFANMKEQRMRILSHQNNSVQRSSGGKQLPPWGRGRFGN